MLDEETVLLIRTNIFECLPKKRIKRLRHTSNGRGVLTGRKCCDIHHAFRRVGTASGSVQKIGVFLRTS